MNDTDGLTLDDLIREGMQALPGEDGWREAELLLVAALKCDRAWLRAHGDEPVSRALVLVFRDRLRRRAAGEPMAYILSQREFWSLPLRVTRDVLIPRPETERLVEIALEQIPETRNTRVADLGTGTGAIALAIASERPLAEIAATDASAKAIEVARENARSLGLEQRISFLVGDWCSALMRQPPFDVIVSNPPYITNGDPHLRRGDLRFEPIKALIGGPDGLDAIRTIIRQTGRHLLNHGWLMLEHGYNQAPAVRALMTDGGFIQVESHADFGGHERVTVGRRPI